LYSSSNIIRIIKSRRMRWTGHVARGKEAARKTKTEVGGRQDEVVWFGLVWLKKGTSGEPL
jgi:hypothetical protein